jgi:hypothetical protein
VGGVYGYRIDSDLPLTRLRSGPLTRGSLSVAVAHDDLLAEPAEIISLVLGLDADPVFAVARTEDSLLTWCRLTGSARIDAGAGQIFVAPEGDPEAQEDRLLNTLIALLLAQRGELVLHAAAVQTERGAVIFCGPSGRGKSTLAAVLGTQGFPILAEDVIVLTVQDGCVLAWPGPIGVRLDPATAQTLGGSGSTVVRGKHLHVPQAPSSSAGVPVAAIVALDPRGGSELEVTALDGPGGMAAIFLSVTRFEPDAWPGSFRQTAGLIRRVPCHRARLPDDLGRVEQIAAQLLGAVTSRGPRARATEPVTGGVAPAPAIG